jgi:hypothetical protein
MDEVPERGRATPRPVQPMMAVAPRGRASAPGHGAALITSYQSAAHRQRHDAAGTADVDRFGVVAKYDGDDRRVAREPPHGASGVTAPLSSNPGAEPRSPRIAARLMVVITVGRSPRTSGEAAPANRSTCTKASAYLVAAVR